MPSTWAQQRFLRDEIPMISARITLTGRGSPVAKSKTLSYRDLRPVLCEVLPPWGIFSSTESERQGRSRRARTLGAAGERAPPSAWLAGAAAVRPGRPAPRRVSLGRGPAPSGTSSLKPLSCRPEVAPLPTCPSSSRKICRCCRWPPTSLGCDPGCRAPGLEPMLPAGLGAEARTGRGRAPHPDLTRLMSLVRCEAFTSQASCC